MTLEPVIGLEVHAQLSTNSKMFCGCSAAYASTAPNTHVCAICSGMPGALPVINRRAVEFTLRAALALHCRIPANSKFDRKNYSYPDLPKGYQISQYDSPIGESGYLEFMSGGELRRCGIIRVHLEEDTGKSSHVSVDGCDVSLVDYNRSGVPLMEIVSAPDLKSPDDARDYFASLRQTLMYLGVCDGNLQEGSMRADLNVSLREPGGEYGTKVEIKNLNSFRAVQRALEYEIERQRRVLEAGGTLDQETRGWSEAREETLSQRSKEYAHDYRYFPEPDLPPLAFSTVWVDEVREALPEMPRERALRFQSALSLGADTAEVLTLERAFADYFEATLAAARSASPGQLANWLTGDVRRIMNERRLVPETLSVAPDALARLVDLVATGEISSSAGKPVLEAMFDTAESPDSIVERLDLRQVEDRSELDTLADAAIAANPAMVADYRRGKLNALNALMGQVMKASKGKAKPPTVIAILKDKLDAAP